MKTNRHILTASNLFLSIYNDETIKYTEKTSIVSAIDAMVYALLDSRESSETNTQFKERVILIIENFNYDAKTKE